VTRMRKKNEKRRADWMGFKTNAEYMRERRAKMKAHPEQYQCLCGRPGTQYDESGHSVRCAFCAWCEGQDWTGLKSNHVANSAAAQSERRRRSVIMPYRLALNVSF
jgi:hypothetical protein